MRKQKKEEYQRVRERADTQKTKAAETGKKDKKKRDIEPAAAALRPEHPTYSIERNKNYRIGRGKKTLRRRATAESLEKGKEEKIFVYNLVASSIAS